MDRITIGFGTLSEKKINAAVRAAKRTALDVTLIGANTKTGEMEQPMGRFGDPAPMSEGMAGARTRAREALIAVPAAEYGLGVESQLLEIDMAHYLDLAVICLWKRGAPEGIYTTSTGILCPAEYVKESLRSGRRTTAGKFFAAATGAAHDDWHSHLTAGRISRDDLLEQAIFAALVLTFPPPAAPPA